MATDKIITPEQEIEDASINSPDKLNISDAGPNDKVFTFDSIRIGLASPEKIRQWSKGESNTKLPIV